MNRFRDGAHLDGRLLVVSNRGPVEHYVDGDGRLRSRAGQGGVATALSAIAGPMPVHWIASAVTSADRTLACAGRTVDLGADNRLRMIAPGIEPYDLFYRTFSNPILWFLQHPPLWDQLRRRNLHEEAVRAWTWGYVPINRAFADAVADELRAEEGGGRVMLHDYHLYLAPAFIRERCPEAALQHFIHIPWPSAESWQALPSAMVRSICAGLLANDSVIFQTQTFAQNFLRTCEVFLHHADIRVGSGEIICRGRRTAVWANPISVNAFALRSCLSSPEARRYHERLAAGADQRTIVRVDRLDPSKNIAAGFEAYDRLLQAHPEWCGRLRFLAFLIPSRQEIPEYREYADKVFALVAEINARHGRADWTPIVAFYEHNRLQALVGLSLYDVLLVNPVADGMNLVAKEGPVVNRRDGVLALSTSAGSFEELREGALPVRPADVEQTAETLHAALCMPAEERRERAVLLRQAVSRHDLHRWLELQMEDLAAIAAAKAPVRARTAQLSRV